MRAKHCALVGLCLGVVGLSGCTDWAGYDIDYFWENIPILSTMRHTVTYDPYEMPRLPAEHTIPVVSPIGDVPPPFTQAQLDSAAATLTNPYGSSPSAEVLARGKFLYDTQCIVCHGPAGAGDGSIVGGGKFPFAPAINSAATAARSDGYIYGMIAVGRGLMPPYGEKLRHLDRWAVVTYVRELERQASGNAAPMPDVEVPMSPVIPAGTSPAEAPPSAKALTQGVGKGTQP
ncbi:MAG TPA: c-type cytochrome [Longimicrobiaceae bacterium]|nr:c-type cytochrome [Longimicrobiaceae bacterium]